MLPRPSFSRPSRLATWFDNAAYDPAQTGAPGDRIDWLRCIPFIGMHLACLAVVWVGWSFTAVAAAVALYLLRMFAITGFYHRYFSHRSFRTSRAVQGAMAFIGCTSVQRDPMWWAAHHAHHHAHSEDDEDPHSPLRKGFWKSHVGWFMTPNAFATRYNYVPDWVQFRELRLLNRFDLLPPVLLALAVFGAGWAMEIWAPGLGADRWQMLVWGFFVSTVALYHCTFTINSLCHQFGTRRFATDDNSRNNWLLALITLGEGWHNNHHHYPGSTRQGFYWWEVDLTYYGLRLMEALGLIWDLRGVPERVLSRNRIDAQPPAVMR